jgi:phage gpG-like protein
MQQRFLLARLCRLISFSQASRHVLRSLAPQMKQEIENFREEDIPNKKAKKMPLKAMIDLTGDSD